MSTPQFDAVIHEPNRLQICAFLAPFQNAEFQVLRDELERSWKRFAMKIVTPNKALLSDDFSAASPLQNRVERDVIDQGDGGGIHRFRFE